MFSFSPVLTFLTIIAIICNFQNSAVATPLISIFRNWTYALFYTMAELWGSVVVSVLFWGFANEVTTSKEAKRYYPFFGLGANVALIFSGQVSDQII